MRRNSLQLPRIIGSENSEEGAHAPRAKQSLASDRRPRSGLSSHSRQLIQLADFLSECHQSNNRVGNFACARGCQWRFARGLGLCDGRQDRYGPADACESSNHFKWAYWFAKVQLRFLERIVARSWRKSWSGARPCAHSSSLCRTRVPLCGGAPMSEPPEVPHVQSPSPRRVRPSRSRRLAARGLIDDHRCQPRGGLTGVERVKEVDCYASNNFSIFLGDQHSGAGPGIESPQASRNLRRLCGIPELPEQPTQRGPAV